MGQWGKGEMEEWKKSRRTGAAKIQLFRRSQPPRLSCDLQMRRGHAEEACQAWDEGYQLTTVGSHRQSLIHDSTSTHRGRGQPVSGSSARISEQGTTRQGQLEGSIRSTSTHRPNLIPTRRAHRPIDGSRPQFPGQTGSQQSCLWSWFMVRRLTAAFGRSARTQGVVQGDLLTTTVLDKSSRHLGIPRRPRLP